MNINGREIGNDNPCYIVAEIGINHNGNIEIAKKLIDAAKDAGCDAVKFQKRTVDTCYSQDELARPRESPFGTTNGDLKKGLEFGVQEYDEIASYCRKKQITWFASPWDVESVKFLDGFVVPCYKIASACLTDDDLLIAIRNNAKPTIISTGMSSIKQIERAINFFVDIRQGEIVGILPIALLACTSTYPTRLEDLNLYRIVMLQAYHPTRVIGWSHHAVSPWPALCAAVMGAKIVEAHITLDRSMWGSDQSASLEPAAFKKLVQEIRDFEIAKGNGLIGMIESERPIMEKLRRFK